LIKDNIKILKKSNINKVPKTIKKVPKSQSMKEIWRPSLCLPPKIASLTGFAWTNCYECNGNCLTKNIFEEHNLSMKGEMELAARMKKIIAS
jgi:hypothetical protein